MSTVELFITSLSLNKKVFQNCEKLKDVLTLKGITYSTFDISRNKDDRERMVAVSGNKVLPQIHVNGKSIGSFEDIQDWIENDKFVDGLKSFGWRGVQDKSAEAVKKVYIPPPPPVSMLKKRLKPGEKAPPTLDDLKKRAEERSKINIDLKNILSEQEETDFDLTSPNVSDLDEDDPWYINDDEIDTLFEEDYSEIINA